MKFFGYHGVLEEERRLGQRFEVDLELSLDLRPVGQADDINLGVSYADVFATVEEVVTGQPFNLLEAVAEKVCQQVLCSYPLVDEVKVIVKKPGAPINGVFAYMAVEISRRRGSDI